MAQSTSTTNLSENQTENNPDCTTNVSGVATNTTTTIVRMDPTNFQRRTAESSRIIRNNIHLMFEEIRPYVEQARTNLLNRQNSAPVDTVGTSTSGVTSTTTPTELSNNNDYVINIDVNAATAAAAAGGGGGGADENILSRQNSVPDHLVSSPPSPNNNNVDDGQVTSEALRHMPEARALLETIQKYVPFVMILSAKAIYDHREGILNLIALFFTFSHANSVVKQEVMKQSRRSITALLIVILYIIGCIVFIDYVFNDEKLYSSLVFAAVYTKPLTVWRLLWAVSVSDFMLKLITVMIKIVVILVPGFVMPFQRRGKVYLFLESISQFYRSLLPIQPWLWFLLDSYQGAERVMGVLLAAAYMVAKGADLAARLKLIKTACQKLVQNVNFGTAASKEQLRLAGEQCPICHDIFNDPVALQPCKHVFCETCVCAWLDREPTCPLCRAMVSDDPAWRDGSTTHCVQLY